MKTDRILQHEDWQREPFRRFLTHHLIRHGLPVAGLQDAPQGQVSAYINHGRWVADCPNPDCRGALVVTVADPILLCTDCGNEANGGKPFTVVFPAQREAIERELMKRPLLARKAKARNWQPGETIADLRAEAKRFGWEKS